MHPLLRLTLPHHWTWPRLSESERQAQLALDRHVNETRAWPAADDEPLIERLRPWVRGRVLELGAGEGEVTQWLAHWGESVDAVEPRGTAPSTWLRVLPHLEIPAMGEWDTVVTAHMVHHVADREELACRIATLAPDCTWVMLEPTHTWRRAARLAYWYWEAVSSPALRAVGRHACVPDGQ